MGVVAAILVLISGPVAAKALSGCGDRQAILNNLGNKYGERRVAQGLTLPNKQIAEFFLNRSTGTWTFVITHASGVTCIISLGTDADVFAVPQSLLPGKDT